MREEAARAELAAMSGDESDEARRERGRYWDPDVDMPPQALQLQKVPPGLWAARFGV